ncbi:hypothetical protein ID866_4000 [Astraeus odoratus]|nr:hypothetical protein ID866_4000 [Astraeus odoratus]
MTDLEHCGGCSNLVPGGSNCRMLYGALSVTCVSGRCIIISCQPGYTLLVAEHKCIAS